jgi:hypothetical protein
MSGGFPEAARRSTDPAILASMKTPDKPDASTFERFTKVLRALVAVPKAELDQALAKEREEKRAKQRLPKSAS